MTAIEVSRLAELETVISDGLVTFRAVGEALAAVRDEQLYLDTHRTFADYCRDRWGLSPASAYRRIGQAEDAKDLPPGEPARSQRQIASEKRTSRARDTVAPGVIDVTSTLTMVESDDEPSEPARPDTPKLNTILEVMRLLEPDIAGVLADRDQYEQLLRWARSFKDAYEIAHNIPKVTPKAGGKRNGSDVQTHFKQKHAVR